MLQPNYDQEGHDTGTFVEQKIRMGNKRNLKLNQIWNWDQYFIIQAFFIKTN